MAEKLGKLGIELIEGLVPDPLDALELMYDFAGSYKEAWNRIKQDNLQNGFAMGLAAYLVIPRWEWAEYWARTTVSRDVATQVIGAVGIAENAYNEGLVRGFLYGEKHSKAQADKLRQKAFNALVKVGTCPGTMKATTSTPSAATTSTHSPQSCTPQPPPCSKKPTGAEPNGSSRRSCART